jgi:hypothetical protein
MYLSGVFPCHYGSDDFLNHDALRHILKNLFCRIWILFILIIEAVAHTGQS